jgi:glycerate kinase
MRLVVAPDKFKGAANARAAASAMARGARRAGWLAEEVPLADGGEGTLDAFGGANRILMVSGPLGDPVEAGWRLDGDLAVIEMARASGLALAGGKAGNDPLRATTKGTGELLLAAIASGARRVIVGVGGSATTDGGAGALEVLGTASFAARGVTVEVACDVETRFRDAARVFGPQKGADPEAVVMLEARLVDLAERYQERFGVALEEVPHSGAAGGLAGGLFALGARLCSGFDLIAEAVGLDRALDGASLVLTGEGRFDSTSLQGKVVGGVAHHAELQGIKLLVVAGVVAEEVQGTLPAISLVERYGSARALAQTTACLEEVVEEWLILHSPSG